MIVLDTNVISEVMGTAPSKTVVEWLDRQESSGLYLTTITIAELSYGLEVLADGKRKQILQDRLDIFVTKGFRERILSFDEKAARMYSHVMAQRKRIGRPLSTLDAQIAAITLVNGFAIATRNVSDFEEVGLTIINPFV